jgi:peptide/nickel transport system permease protein/nickel transport system permease protein
MAVAFLAVLIGFIALFAPLIATHDPLEAVLQDALQPPGTEHWFGTDALGRDVFSRVVFGARTSVVSTLTLVTVILVCGTLLGIVAGFFGRAVDAVIMRLADSMLAFPDLVLAMAIAGILGPNMINSIAAIAVVSWTKYARLARSLVLKIKNCDYITAARMTGTKNRYILWRYMLPNALPTMVITAATDIGAMMLALASLSFLGFGVQPPTPEWGYMLSEGRQYFQSSPWLLWCPGAAMFIVVVVFNLLGDSLRDILDPKQEQTLPGRPEDEAGVLRSNATVNQLS